MSLVVKICGLKTEETVAAAVESGADMVGFVLFPASPRFVTAERARALAGPARGKAEVAALIVDLDDEAIAEAVRALKPDWLQVHGRESVERTREIGRRSGVRVMKALGVSGPGDLDRVPAYAEVSDRLLFDAKPPKGADRPGGHGKAFDWRILAGLPGGLDFMLSGGLNAGNLAEALAATHAGAVDVSSGVETAPGVKSPDLIRAFIAAVRKAERQGFEAVAGVLP